MAASACKSLHHIFEKPLPENPTLLESLSAWNQIKPVKPIPEQSSFTEIFGELHFKENSESSSSSSSHHINLAPQRQSGIFGSSSSADSHKDDENKSLSSSRDSFSSRSSSSCYRNSSELQSFSSMNSDSLQLCTEGLGFESSGDVEEYLSNEMMNEDNWKQHQEDEKVIKTKQHHFPSLSSSDQNLNGDLLFMRRLSRTSGAGAFPPPISSIGKSGKPRVSFKSYRQDGRFVLKEVRIPTQEFLHACREDGRLKLHFVQPKDEILEEDEEEEEEEDEVSEEEESEEQDEEDDDGVIN